MLGTTQLPAMLLQGGLIPKGTRILVFQRLYWVFLVLGTLVGIVVIAYMLYNAYKYRDGAGTAESVEVERPQLGELPSGSGGGRKLFLSFAMSAIVVISLIAWTYGVFLYVEQGAAQEAPTVGQGEEPMTVHVVGYQFGWRFVYPNGKVVDSGANEPFRVPADRMIRLRVNSSDVFHNFGVPELRVKTDAMPGQMTETWFIAPQAGKTYTAKCYELCGAGHSNMQATVQVMSGSAFQEWYTSSNTATPSPNGTTTPNATATPTNGSDTNATITA